ncbi:aquaporin Z [Microbacteriaceae bacterium VKM Ac-2855]|nr:aquaporin Z [Microbacteriaceae bacterium VKM Ac-2855]
MTSASAPLETQPELEPTSTTSATSSRLAAEIFGTFLLVFGTIGTALFAAAFGFDDGTPLGVGFLGVSIAIGLTVFIGASTVGHISGGHFNPAVTLGLAAAGRFSWRGVLPYIVAQLIGGGLASSLLAVILSGGPDGALAKAQAGGFASNGFGEHSPGGFSLAAVGLTEIVATAVFLFVILGVTGSRAIPGIAPAAIGGTLTLLHLATIPISNTSLNPARSIATAIYGGGDAIGQLWLFILAPIIGAMIAGATQKALFDR